MDNEPVSCCSKLNSELSDDDPGLRSLLQFVSAQTLPKNTINNIGKSVKECCIAFHFSIHKFLFNSLLWLCF